MINKTYKILFVILIFSFATRMYRLHQPPTYYFDEVYHAATAKLYARNDPSGYEWWHPAPEPDTAIEWLHPPISKLFMGASIWFFGENAFAWRLPSAVFGTLTIALIFFLAQSLLSFDPKTKTIAVPTALLAAFLASLDGLLLVQSRIAMNDIYVVTFILAALLLYWRWFNQPKHKHFLIVSSLCTGLAIATKWSGVFLLGVVGLMEFSRLVKHRQIEPKRYAQLLISFVFIPIVIYFLSFSQFWLQGHTLDQFIELHNQIYRYQTGLTATHPFQSKPWQWPIPLRTVWYHVRYDTTTIANIYALANPIISWGGLVAIAWMILKAITRKRIVAPYFLVLSAYFLMWTPWLLSPRIMFYYHYLPAIPFLAIILAIALRNLWDQHNSAKGLVVAFITISCAAFVFFFPLWTGLFVPQTLLPYFFWLKGWK